MKTIVLVAFLSAGCAVQAGRSEPTERTDHAAASQMAPAGRPETSTEAPITDAEKGYTCVTPNGRYTTYGTPGVFVTPISGPFDRPWCAIGSVCTVDVVSDASPDMTVAGICQ